LLPSTTPATSIAPFAAPFDFLVQELAARCGGLGACSWLERIRDLVDTEVARAWKSAAGSCHMDDERIQWRIAELDAPEVERFHELAHEGSLTALVKLLRRREPRGVEHQGVADRCCSVLGALMSDVLNRRVDLLLTELSWHRAAPFAVSRHRRT
jgi:hypothetical protein